METWVITTGLFINIWRLKTMSKIIIDEIEAKTADVALTPNGTGNVEVQSELVDGTLQLNTSTQLNNVKIKTPPDSAGQSHTLILPDNDVDVDKYLKVKSVTGSGSTAVGQLEYASIANIDTNNLNADNFTSGNVASARMPTSFPNTSGFALKLISKAEVTSGNFVHNFSFTGLDHDSNYLLIGKNILWDGAARQEFAFLDGSNNVLSNGVLESHEKYAKYNETYYIYSGNYNSPYNTNHFRSYGQQGRLGGFIAEFNTDTYWPAMHVRGFHQYYDAHQYSGGFEMWMSMSTNSSRIEGIRIDKDGTEDFYSPTQIMLYKYVDS